MQAHRVRANRITRWIQVLPDFVKYLLLISINLAFTYYAPSPVKAVWYILTLVLYFYSKEEALWLAFFLTTTDGFAGFFGIYEATLTVLPGLPAVEIVQVYVLLSVVKAARSKIRPVIFFNKYLQILLIYLIFLIIWGQMMGLSGGLNVYFRVLKGFLPMLLFYSVPRLFMNEAMYARFFRIIFVVVLFAFAAQLFTLFTGLTPAEAAGIVRQDKLEDEDDFRVFFNASSTLLGLFGSIYYLSLGGGSRWDRILCLMVLIVALVMAFLSATRGWIIAFSVITVLAIITTGTLRSLRSILILILFIPAVLWVLSNPVISRQLGFTRERLEKLESISEGDLTAQGTLQRLDYRSQRVMGGWKENPIFGWGFSDMGYKYGDGHVGNQSLLAVTGLVGYILLNGFLVFFVWRIISVYFRSVHRVKDRNSLLIFPVFLLGWFIIHSTSGQQFNFAGTPGVIVSQAVFFSFGALKVRLANNLNNA